MISVIVAINGKPIHRRSAVRISEDEKGIRTYRVYDSNVRIKHDPKDGAVKLAKKLFGVREA